MLKELMSIQVKFPAWHIVLFLGALYISDFIRNYDALYLAVLNGADTIEIASSTYITVGGILALIIILVYGVASYFLEVRENLKKIKNI